MSPYPEGLLERIQSETNPDFKRVMKWHASHYDNVDPRWKDIEAKGRERKQVFHLSPPPLPGDGGFREDLETQRWVAKMGIDEACLEGCLDEIEAWIDAGFPHTGITSGELLDARREKRPT
jgi:hypothetical protein